MPSPTDTATFAKRLAAPFQGATRIEELRNPQLGQRAQRFYKQHPQMFGRIVMSLMDGIAPAKVARQCKTDVQLVRYLRRMYPEAMAAGRQQIVSNLEEASLTLSQRLVDEAPKIPLQQVAAVLSTVIEKTQLLTGNVTSRTEHINAPTPEDLKAMFDRLPAAKIIDSP
jgi:hypothetical protein